MEPIDTTSMTAEEMAAATGISLDAAKYMVAVRDETWAGDLLVDENGVKRPLHHGENYQAE